MLELKKIQVESGNIYNSFPLGAFPHDDPLDLLALTAIPQPPNLTPNESSKLK